MFKRILVPLDGSSLAESVLPHAIPLAQAFDAEVTLLRTVERSDNGDKTPAVDPLTWQMRQTEAQAYLDETIARLEEFDLKLKKALVEGRAAKRIIDYAHSHDVDLIVISSHGRSGLSKWNISSVVQKVILRAYMPVLIVRAYESVVKELTSLHYRRLLVPVDGSQRAECVLPVARALSSFHDCLLLLAHVVNKPEVPRHVPLSGEEEELVDRLVERNREAGESYLQDLKSRLSSSVETRLLVSDNAAAALHELVDRENIDLVLLSAHGYTGAARWPYGSVALNFIAYGAMPLLIVQDLPEEKVKRTRAEKAVKEEKGH